MKKTVVALLALAATTAAFATPTNGSFYVGGKWGASTFHKTVKLTTEDSTLRDGTGQSYGLFAGYILNDHVSFELGWQKIASDKYHFADGTIKKLNQNIFTLDAKFNQYLGNNINVYALGGLGFAVNHLDKGLVNYGHDADSKSFKVTVTPYIGAGAQYFFNNSLALGAEYSLWLSSFRNPGKSAYNYAIDTGLTKDKALITNKANIFKPDTHLWAATLTYYIGNQAPVAVAPVVREEKHSFSSESLFALNSYKLNPVAAEKDFTSIIEHYKGAQTASISVVGHTDWTGSQQYNLKLSLNRANAVAKYLEAHGVKSNDITITGVGPADPVTNGCKDLIKNKKALIKCLAPDRRVDVSLYTFENYNDNN